MEVTTETLIIPGGEIKTLSDDGDTMRIGGYLVKFGSPDETDLSAHRDYFTKSTDFDIEDGATSAVYYHHGLNPTLKARKLGTATLSIQDAGVWMETELKARDDYERNIQKMVRAGKLGLSSGSAAHLVERKAVGEAHEITRWPLGLDASLTPTPANPRSQATALKSLVEEGELGEIEAKSDSVLGDINADMTGAALSMLFDRLRYSVIYSALSKSVWPDDRLNVVIPAPLNERLDFVKQGLDEFRDKAWTVVQALMKGEGDEDSAKAAKSLAPDAIITELKAGLLEGLRFSDHSEQVLAANQGLSKRLSEIVSDRAGSRKSGRVLSQANCDRIKSHRDSLQSLLDEMSALLEEHGPKPDADEAATKAADEALNAEIDALEIEFMRQQMKLNELHV